MFTNKSIHILLQILVTGTLLVGCLAGDLGVQDTGELTPALNFSPRSADFGTVTIGNGSPVQIFTLTNSGNIAASGCTAPILTGSSPTEFVIDNDTCQNFDLAPGGTCTFTVHAAPTAEGAVTATASRACVVGGSIGTFGEGLTVTGNSVVSLTLSPLAFNFGTVSIPQTASSATFEVFNPTAGTAPACSAATLGPGGTDNFTITSDGCSGVALTGGTKCFIELTATPTAAITHQTTLFIDCSTGGSLRTNTNQIQVTGSATADLVFSQRNAHHFGRDLFVDTASGAGGSNYTFSIKNIGLSDATGCVPTLTNNTDFSITNIGDCTGTLAAQAECSVNVQANPSRLGLVRDTLTLGCDTPGSPSVSSQTNGLVANGGDTTQLYTFKEIQTHASTPRQIAVHPSDRWIYLASEGDHSIYCYQVLDKRSGSLSNIAANTVTDNGGTNFAAPRALTISRDGRFLYVGSTTEDAITVFSINQITGALTFVEEQVNLTGPILGLNTIFYLAESPDGSNLYSAGNVDDAISVFIRDRNTGTLTFSEAHVNGFGTPVVAGIDSPGGIAIPADGRVVYVTGAGADDSVAIFKRDLADGTLTFSERHQNGVGGVTGLAGASDVIVSPDSLFLYAAGSTDDGFGIFLRDKSTGSLTFSSAVSNGTLAAGVGLGNAIALASTKDARNLIVAGNSDNALTSLRVSSVTHSLRSVLQDGQTDGFTIVDGLESVFDMQFDQSNRNLFASASLDNDVSVFNYTSAQKEPLVPVEVLQDGAPNGLNTVEAFAVSPNNSFVFSVSSGDNALLAFSIASFGTVSLTSTAIDGANGVDGLGSARDVKVSPDGAHVYVVGDGDNALTAWSVDTSGNLTLVDVKIDNAGGVDGIQGARFLAISPEGNHVYVSGFGENKLGIFQRNTTSGALSFIGAITNAGIGGSGLNAPKQIHITQSGDHVYVASSGDDKISIFARNDATGLLAFQATFDDNTGGANFLAAPSAVEGTIDGSFLYVSSETEDAITVFSRNAVTGLLTFVETQTHTHGGVDAMNGPLSIQVTSSPASYVLVNSGTTSELTVFARDPVNGKLSHMQSLKGTAAAGSTDIALSPDNKIVYSTASTANTMQIHGLRFLDPGLIFEKDILTSEPTSFSFPTTNTSGVRSITDMAISHDGRSLIIANQNDIGGSSFISIYNRFPQTGDLSFATDIAQGAVSCGGIACTGIDNITAIKVSSDNQNIYSISSTDNTLNVYTRDLDAGTITFLERHVHGFLLVDGIRNGQDLVISPDGMNIYISGFTDDAIAHFTRNPATGSLTFVRVYENNLSGISNMDGPKALAISPDGNHLYVTATASNSLVVFSRNQSSGALSFVESHLDNISGVNGLATGIVIKLSPDGAHLYVLSQGDSSVAHFERNPTTGALTFIRHLVDDTNGVDGLFNPRDMQLSLDGTLMFISSFSENSISIFYRDPETGVLFFQNKIVNDDTNTHGLVNANILQLSPDGRQLYVSGHSSDASPADRLSVFEFPY